MGNSPRLISPCIDNGKSIKAGDTFKNSSGFIGVVKYYNKPCSFYDRWLVDYGVGDTCLLCVEVREKQNK